MRICDRFRDVLARKYLQGVRVRRKRRTPIEIAIDRAGGTPVNERQAKYVAKRQLVGLRRIAIWVPEAEVADFRARAQAAVVAHCNVEADA